jgi:nitrate/TMAO reductase-like tetraheme cytochrome c subunit
MRRARLRGLEPLPLLALLPLALLLPAGATAQSPAEEVELCLGCHEDPEIAVTFPSGESRSLKVDKDAFARSVHGGKLRCTDCHPGLGEVPHPERRYRNADEFRAGFRDACKTCHFANYTKYLDSVHYSVLAKNAGPAPGCTDCHDSHAIQPASRPRTRISETCAACHSDIQETYAQSVHGKALRDPANADVPVCTDCHRAHDISDPREASWLLRTPEICGKCHADAEKMSRYGLSAEVLQTYLADFHGMTASLARGGVTGEKRVTAVCVDCHGVHDIASAKDPGSKVLKANLVKTCQQCHPDATENFPAAWLSHFEPSLEKAPLVYLVKLFYRILIPFIIGGLILQILLHLWRVVVNR